VKHARLVRLLGALGSALILLPPLWLGCTPRPPALATGIELDDPSAANAPPAIHVGDGWWPLRARYLGLSEREVAVRDAHTGRAPVPIGFWDPQTAVEAVSVWTVLCNECHGGRRHLDDVDTMPAPPAGWGDGVGLFFGERRAYRQLFEVVRDGGPPRADGPADMPAWRSILSNEMIWALLYFLEYQSGGIESRFPPSLYPRPPRLLGEP
jgi:hypothetical protein